MSPSWNKGVAQKSLDFYIAINIKVISAHEPPEGGWKELNTLRLIFSPFLKGLSRSQGDLFLQKHALQSSCIGEVFWWNNWRRVSGRTKRAQPRWNKKIRKSKESTVNSAIMLVWKIWICSNTIDVLRNSLNILNFVFSYVWFHSWESLAKHRKLFLAEPSQVGIQKMHMGTFLKHLTLTSVHHVLWDKPSTCLLWLSFWFQIPVLPPPHNNSQIYPFWYPLS